MRSKKEYQVVRQIVDLLRDDRYEPGSRLPSERILAEKLNISRNTLRSAVKIIEASGALEVRPGSGYFLLSKSLLDDIVLVNDVAEERRWISEQLEAFYLFEPKAVELATLRMSADEKKKLEDCVVRMSKALLENNIDEIVKSHKEFHQIIAAGTGNRSIRQMLERLNLTYTLVANVMNKISQDERNQEFARHVNLFKAINSGDAKAARKMSLQMILSTSLLLNKFEGIKLPGSVNDEIEEQIISMKRSKSDNS